MKLTEILDPEMNGHEWRRKMRKYENGGFPNFYKFSKDKRRQKKDKILEIQRKQRAKIL